MFSDFSPHCTGHTFSTRPISTHPRVTSTQSGENCGKSPRVYNLRPTSCGASSDARPFRETRPCSDTAPLTSSSLHRWRPSRGGPSSRGAHVGEDLIDGVWAERVEVPEKVGAGGEESGRHLRDLLARDCSQPIDHRDRVRECLRLLDTYGEVVPSDSRGEGEHERVGDDDRDAARRDRLVQPLRRGGVATGCETESGSK
mmetsp:Transcript_42235/g.90112  ORF Transcript_42235/g.90112 Transcript_42235/m.90112 type:complete len:200 (-) Transcript_42235:809-1408(-)